MKKTEAIGFVFILFALLALPLACGHHAVSADGSTDGSFTVVDTTPPDAVTDLAVSNATTHSLTLTWTAPGDDGNNGTATEYDIRYATANIDNENWEFAIQASGEPAPGPAGSNETFVVDGLTAATTYYFALKTIDDAGNRANLSNIASGATLTSGGGGGGGGGGPGPSYFTVDFLGKVTSVPISWDGSLAVPLLATSPDGTASLKIDKGTKVLDAAGKPVDKLTIRTVTNQPLPLLPDTTRVGDIYSLTPSDLVFDKPATLTLSFSHSEVPEGALSLTIVYGSEAGLHEVEVERTTISGLEALSARINHTCIFAILARMVSFSELDIGYMGQKVTSGNITPDGFLMESLEFTIQNGELYFSLPEGTRILNREGKPPAMIMIDPVTPSELPPSPSDDSVILMPFIIQPALTIDPIMKVTIHYDDGELDAGINEEDLVLAYYDEAREKWVMLPTEVDVEANTVTAWVGHTSTFAIISNIASNIAGEFPWWWIIGGVLGIVLLAFLIRHRIRSRPADASQARLTK